MRIIDLAGIAARCTLQTPAESALGASIQLRFGPLWGRIRSVWYGRHEALVALDLAGASTDIACARYVALGRPLPPSIFSHVYARVTSGGGDGSAPVLTETITDETGRVLAEIDDIARATASARRRLSG